MPGSKKQILETINMIKEKIEISEAEKKRIDRMNRRNTHLDSLQNGMDVRSKPYKNKKKYNRKLKHGSPKQDI